MKLVREHINENFKEQSDPLEDMRIGLWKYTEPQENTGRGLELVDEYLIEVMGLKNWSREKLKGWGLYWLLPNILTGLLAMVPPKIIADRIYEILTEKDLIKNGLVKKFFIKKTLSEKFEEISDPINDLGVGSYKVKKTFESRQESIKFLIVLIPTILQMEEIPKDILMTEGQWIREEYHFPLRDYYKTYISVPGRGSNYDPETLAIELYKQGFEMNAENYKFAKQNYLIN